MKSISLLIGLSAILADNNINTDKSEKILLTGNSHRFNGNNGNPVANLIDILTQFEKTSEKNYSILERQTNDSNIHYLEALREKESSFEKAVKKHGYGKITQLYLDAQIQPLNYAKQHLKKPERERLNPEREYMQITEHYLDNLQYVSSAPINYEDKGIKEACEEWVKIRIELFERLLKVKKDSKDFGELLRNGFNEKDLNEFVARQNKSLDRFYDALDSARTGMKGLFASGPINEVRNFTKDFYASELINAYYKKNN